MIDTKKQYRRQNAWKATTKDRIEVNVPKGIKEAWQEQAKAEGLSLNEWIIKRVSRD